MTVTRLTMVFHICPQGYRSCLCLCISQFTFRRYSNNMYISWSMLCLSVCLFVCTYASIQPLHSITLSIWLKFRQRVTHNLKQSTCMCACVCNQTGYMVSHTYFTIQFFIQDYEI